VVIVARILVVYNRQLFGDWRSTYDSHVNSFRRFSDHDCFYLNADRRSIPRYLSSLDPDLVVFHYTFLAARQYPEVFSRLLRRLDFIRDWRCPKALVPHDEQAHSDLLCQFVQSFGVTHVFTPAPSSEWARIYEGVDFDTVAFRTVLTGYIDESVVRETESRAQARRDRPIDVGYRSWDTWPYYGRHGRLKGEIGRAVKERAPAFDLVADISGRYQDAFLGDSWLDFLLKCKYTIGVEGGSSVFDRDGGIAQKTVEYLTAHDDPSFEEVEAACFPGMDGRFRYFLLGPRHFEAIMTRTCQVLVEGEYGGALVPGRHYIELRRDFSNLDNVLRLMKEDRLRAAIVERAYQDIVVSGMYSYRAFASLVLSESLRNAIAIRSVGAPGRPSAVVAWNRLDERLAMLNSDSAHARMLVLRDSFRATFRPILSRALGEERLKSLLARIRRLPPTQP
jgi:hypothetical protein